MIITLKKLIHIGLDLIFPLACVNCGKKSVIICHNCLANISPAVDFKNENLYCLFNYHQPAVKKLVWHLKYRNVKAVAEVLAPYLADKILALIDDDLFLQAYLNNRKILLVPVPLSRQRARYKSGNQAVKLVQALVRKKNYLDYRSRVVIKNRHTKTQVACRSRVERLTNLKEAFSVPDKNVVSGKVCVIIDDVITTGATMTEIKKELLVAGAVKVLGLAIARS